MPHDNTESVNSSLLKFPVTCVDSTLTVTSLLLFYWSRNSDSCHQQLVTENAEFDSKLWRTLYAPGQVLFSWVCHFAERKTPRIKTGFFFYGSVVGQTTAVGKSIEWSLLRSKDYLFKIKRLNIAKQTNESPEPMKTMIN